MQVTTGEINLKVRFSVEGTNQDLEGLEDAVREFIMLQVLQGSNARYRLGTPGMKFDVFNQSDNWEDGDVAQIEVMRGAFITNAGPIDEPNYVAMPIITEGEANVDEGEAGVTFGFHYANDAWAVSLEDVKVIRRLGKAR